MNSPFSPRANRLRKVRIFFDDLNDAMFRGLDFFMDRICLPLIILATIGIVGFMLYSGLGPQPETFELRVDEWTCTQSHSETYTTSVLVGKVVVPQVRTRTVCDVMVRR